MWFPTRTWMHRCKFQCQNGDEETLRAWIKVVDPVYWLSQSLRQSTAPQEILWAILRKFGVPEKFFRLLEAMHRQVVVKFNVSGIERSLSCIIGKKQGEVIGPISIPILHCCHHAWRKAYNREMCIFRTRHGWKMTVRRPNIPGKEFAVFKTMYADDTAVLFPVSA